MTTLTTYARITCRYPTLVPALVFSALLFGCATNLPQVAETVGQGESLVAGQVLAVITGETTREYQPEVRMFELINQTSGERLSVGLESGTGTFSLSLAHGNYTLSRVQISEGPFMSMAELAVEFLVEQDVVTYLGMWRFGVGSPKYGRMVVLSIVDDKKIDEVLDSLVKERYSEQMLQPRKIVMAQPAQVETRLYEVKSYPGDLPYFRRHFW